MGVINRQPRITRALFAMSQDDARAIVDARTGGLAVLRGPDRRRRPAARLSRREMAVLLAEGAIEPNPSAADQYVLTAAGRARAARDRAPADEPFLAQHRGLTDRDVFDPHTNKRRRVRARGDGAAIKALAELRGADGRPILNADEVRAAESFAGDWARGQIGLYRGVDLAAPPRGKAARGPGGGPEAGTVAALDARRRVERVEASLAPTLSELVRDVLVAEESLPALERRRGWPSKAGRAALKIALAQLAQVYRAM
jgi:hypothetical protein